MKKKPRTNREIRKRYQNDWCRFAEEILGVTLDPVQKETLRAVQKNRRVTVRSGHARGKDFLMAVAALCFLLLNVPSKVVLSAPTGRQVTSILMAEVRSLYGNAESRLARLGLSLGADPQVTRILFPGRPTWFLEGFKAADKSTEAWTGYHAPNVFVGLTEASGLETETFNAVEGLLTGNSRLVIVGNPNRTSGEFYHSFRDPQYTKFVLNCLDAPNVKAKKVLIPGQVDFEWVDEHVKKAGWTRRIEESQANPDAFHDFEWEGNWYRPSDLFLVKVLGEFPRAAENALIPLAWVEAANARWLEKRYEQKWDELFSLHLGVDVAGMGRDMTVFMPRYGPMVYEPEKFAKADHMVTAGRVMLRLKEANKKRGGCAYVDSQGEGAGVYSRLAELNAKVVSVKFGEGARGLRDKTGERVFANMRAYCYWAVRDALDPELGGDLMLPPDENLTQDLTEPTYKPRSDGSILIEDKEVIKVRLSRSTDDGDSLAQTYSPKKPAGETLVADAFAGVGVF